MRPPKVTKNMLDLFGVLLRDDVNHYALELSESAGISVGTIYALLARLESGGIVTSELESIDPQTAGRPARRYYTLTPDGTSLAREEINKAVQRMGIPQLRGVQ